MYMKLLTFRVSPRFFSGREVPKKEKNSAVRSLEIEMASRGYTMEALTACLQNRQFRESLKKKVALSSDEEVDAYIEFLRENKSPAYDSLLMSALNFLNKSVMLNELFLTSLQKEDKLPPLLSREEVSCLLSATSPVQHALILEMMYECGLTAGEIVSLKAKNINLKEGIIHVDAEKGGKDRDLPVPSKMLAKLEFILKCLCGSNSYLFPLGVKDHIPEETVQHILDQARKRTGIGKPITPKTLRYSFAVHELETGKNFRHLQQVIGLEDEEWEVLMSTQCEPQFA